MDWTLTLDIVGTIIGLIYLWLEYRASIWLWLAGVLKPMVSAWLYYNQGLYADFGMQTYYVLAAVYGVAVWLSKDHNANKAGRTTGDKAAVGIRHATAATWVGMMAAVLMVWAALHWFLANHTDSTVPVLDSFTTAVSVVAMWALAHKLVEQWLLWLVVDVVCTGLYIYKGIPFHGALYGFYTVMAIVGYRKWSSIVAHNGTNTTDR